MFYSYSYMYLNTTLIFIVFFVLIASWYNISYTSVFGVLTRSDTIRIHHECDGGIEKSDPRTNGDHGGRIFLFHPHTDNGFFFLLTTKCELLRGAFGKFLAWSFISVTNLQTLSCLVYSTNVMRML